MSGQPYRYAKDVENFRSDYMEQLGLRANLDDMNLQANKTYKETGSLPPKSTMKDMRTTPEILADIQKIRLEIIGELKPVCSIQMAQQVVQRVEQSPLNSDGSFLVFLAQNAPELVNQLKKKYKFGIAGNENDVEQMVAFLSSIFTKTREMSSSVKSAFDRPSNTTLSGISEGDLDALKQQFDAIEFKLISQGGIKSGITSLVDTPEKYNVLKLLRIIKAQFEDLQPVLSTTRYNQIKDEFMGQSTNAGIFEQVQINFMGFNEWKDFIERLPSPSTLRTLLDQLTKSEKNKNSKLSETILTNLSSVLPTSLESAKILQITNDIISRQRARPQIQNPLFSQNYVPVGFTPVDPTGTESNAYSRSGLNPPPFEGEELNIIPPEVVALEFCTAIVDNINALTREDLHLSDNRFRRTIDAYVQASEETMKDKFGRNWERIIGYDSDVLDRTIRNVTSNYDYNENLSKGPIVVSEFRSILKSYIPAGSTDMRGFGFKAKGKRRGRPKGSGLVKPISERIDHTKGIKQGHIHVPFGKYILNKNKLDSDLVYFKHAKGYGVKGFPMSKVSNKLGSVLRTIIGGGVPKFEDLQGLSNEEKEYLHKVANKAGIMDKISIPTPSKDKLEQDIHQFEVMKGELLAGNDSPELIKKFKLILLRLSKNGTIPKREASEIMEELLQLGF